LVIKRTAKLIIIVYRFNFRIYFLSLHAKVIPFEANFMKNLFVSLIAIIALIPFSCTNTTESNSNDPIVSTGVGMTGPDAIIYKTKANYNSLVPVIMNVQKTEIISYPAPGDLKYKGKPAIPIQLEDGFLLDNRGINENVAFLSLTYREYMALNATPSRDELMALIIKKEPLTEMYNCGKRAKYKKEAEELNTLITAKDFSKFRKLK